MVTDRIVFLCRVEDGIVLFMMTETLFTSMFAGPSIGTPIIRSLYQRDLISSVAVFKEMNSAPKVEVSTVHCDLECQIIGALFK